nr:hypothetical protein [Tanacetum cinerariifolium]
MATTIEKQVALDEALVPNTQSIDYAFLIWEDFVYQVEHKNQKKCNEMYYPRFTKVIIHHFMSKNPSIPRRNKINWHYVRDDSIFSTIKVVSRHQNTQQYSAMLPIKLTNDEIRNTKAYKEYYAFATGEAAPKLKASTKRKRSGSDTSITPPTATTTPITTVVITPKLTAAAKGKQLAKAKSPSDPSELGDSCTDEGTGSKPAVPDVPTDESEEELLWNSFDDEGADDQEKVGDDDKDDEGNDSEEGEEDDDDQDHEIAKHDDKDDTEESGDVNEEDESDEEDDNEETKDEESFDPIPQTSESSEDEGDGEEDQGLRISKEERLNEEEEAAKLYRDVNINQGRGIQETLDVEDSHVNLTPVHLDGQQESPSVSSHFVTSMLNPPSDAVIMKRRRVDDDDQDERPFAGSDRGYKRRREGKEPELASAPLETATRSAGRSTTGFKSRQMDEPSYPVFEIGADDQPIVQSFQHPGWFSQPKKPPTPDHNWNKTLPGDFKRLRLQEIEDMLLLLVQGKLSNLTVEERFAFNVSLRIFTRSIVIQRCVKDFNWESKATRRGSTLLSQIRTGLI